MNECHTKPQIAIVGAGIIGITNAVLLLEKGYRVTIFTKDNPLETNSDAAIATWYIPDDDKPILQKLCFDSLSKLNELEKIQNTGVSKIPMIYYFKNEEDFKKSAWAKEPVKSAIQLTEEFSADYFKAPKLEKTVFANTPLIDAQVYRKYMFNLFKNLGGNLVLKKIDSFDDLVNDFDVVVNCAGWESKYLTQDSSVYPVRGQVEIAKVDDEYNNKNSLNMRDLDAYVVFRPQSQTCALGTTYQIYNSDKKNSESDRQEIFSKVKPFFPKVESLQFSSQVGIRCGRPDARIEPEYRFDKNGKEKLIMHCYGHGGSGYSASWASAQKVFEYCLDFEKKLVPSNNSKRKNFAKL